MEATTPADYAARLASPFRPPSSVTVREIDHCIAAGMTTFEAAQHLGVRRNGLLRQCRRLGIAWPYDPADRAPRPIWHRGRWWSFAQAAREIGTTRERIKRRFDRGDRGDRLFRPVRKWGRDAWIVGLSVREWQSVLEVARTSGASQAARLFCIPSGAVQAALRGEWERLA